MLAPALFVGCFDFEAVHAFGLAGSGEDFVNAPGKEGRYRPYGHDENYPASRGHGLELLWVFRIVFVALDARYDEGDENAYGDYQGDAHPGNLAGFFTVIAHKIGNVITDG